MIIHVVQSGESTNEIAKKYGVSEERLILDNEIQNPNNLAIGETLIILIPQVTHIVQEGDTLYGIANLYGITVLQLLRNNPYLSGRNYIYQGEIIVISYENEKVGKLSTYGYAYPYINTDVLKKTLPFLTYITVYSYSFTAEG
ncbi:MAG TPA: LysM peptidoglycan-binding domain-containing protein, partial [Clostridiales bacterium]|nr:LysM peptidoglycan-binding domain-containing protein [Clostridiales bacterium]